MKLGDVAAQGAGVTFAVQIGQTLVQFVSVVALARLLTPTDFGLVGMVTAVIGIASIVQDFGLSMAAIQAPTISEAEQTNLFWANTALGLTCGIIMAASTPLIVIGYHEPRLTPIVPVLSGVFLLSGLSVQQSARLAREFRFKALGIVGILSQAISVAIAIVLAFLGAGFWAIVAQQIAFAGITVIGCFLATKWWPGLPVRGASIKRFLRFGTGVLGTQSISYATKNVDNIVIGAVWGAVPLGLYSRAYQLMLAPLNKINAPLTRVALPILSRIQQDDARFMHYLSKAQVVSCYITASAFALIAGLAEPIVRVLFGERWLAATPLVAILAIGGIFRAVAQIAYWAYLARGASGPLFRQRLVTGLITVVLIVGGVPWGAVGVAVGCTVASLAAWLIAMIHVASATGIDSGRLLRNATLIIACVGVPCGISGWAASTLPMPPVAQILVGVGIAGACFMLAYATIPWIRSDVRFSWGFIRRSVAPQRAERGLDRGRHEVPKGPGVDGSRR
jgi:PST family polysaccharide transporter